MTSDPMPTGDARALPDELDALVVGAGFAGLCALVHLRRMGLRVGGVERGADVGGVWFWNTYPGACCDVESVDYCFSFDDELVEEWEWTERYPAQPEILAYLRHVADRHDLRPLISFGTTVGSLTWDDDALRWRAVMVDGAEVAARFVVLASGQLSVANVPALPGLEDFAGPVIHTGQWPDEEPAALAGRVGVIGTGSSGVQVIPQFAKRAEQLTVFQRTAHYALPAGNRVLHDAEALAARRGFATRRAAARRHPSGTSQVMGEGLVSTTPAEDVAARLDECWAVGGTDFMWSFADLKSDLASNEVAADYVRARIAETVADPATGAALSPRGYPLGSKRLVLEIDYWATYNRDNVRLVDLARDPIERIEEAGVRCASGLRELDVLVLATGYDAFTGALERMQVTGRDGRTLREAWADGPQTRLGLATHGFPNLFFVAGAGSPSVLSNVVVAIEQHVEWLADLLATMERAGHTTVEADVAAQSAWTQEVARAAADSLLTRARSWYSGANVEGKVQAFLPYAGGMGRYAELCDEEAATGYPGFVFDDTPPTRGRDLVGEGVRS